ncbi:unnamed protein product, partial [Thlaspi arvense]
KMENKRMAMMIVVVTMLVMGNLLTDTEAIPFKACYTGCILMCGTTEHGIKKVLCPVTCIKTCMDPRPEENLKETVPTDYFCTLGCATDRCISSSIEDKDKKVTMLLMTMMIVMVMGNLMVQTEAKSNHFKGCYSDCLVVCRSHTTFPKSLLCPFTCLRTCLVPTLPTPSPSSSPDTDLTNEIDNTRYFCKLGCATHHCVSLQILNVEKVANCVDICSDKCP